MRRTLSEDEGLDCSDWHAVCIVLETFERSGLRSVCSPALSGIFSVSGR